LLELRARFDFLEQCLVFLIEVLFSSTMFDFLERGLCDLCVTWLMKSGEVIVLVRPDFFFLDRPECTLDLGIIVQRIIACILPFNTNFSQELDKLF